MLPSHRASSSVVRVFFTLLFSITYYLPCGLAWDEPVGLRDLNSHCPFHPPASLEAWQTRADALRLQLQVATGLYPLPELEPVQPQIYGKIQRDGYTIEKCVFESLPGFFVTGSLYRPSSVQPGTKLPGLLSPHGHWTEARFYKAPQNEIQNLLATGAERFASAAENHMQARCVQLARMGCVVFHWDMIGYCDSQQIGSRAHRFANQPKEDEVTDDGWLLFSPLAESNCQSILGLQSLATMRAVDMLLTLDDVDPDRIAITGASGGGTQSFLGAALDERIQVAFPAVMVSTGMQGGCTCENASLLRVGTSNVELAGLIAPRPLGMTAANDWTVNMPNDGYPELKQLYSLYGNTDDVALFPALHFGHNFNHVSRVSMYGWMNKHLNLGFSTPVLESDFEIATKDELTVWDSQHPRPRQEDGAAGDEFERSLMKTWATLTDTTIAQLLAGTEYEQSNAREILTNGWTVALGLTTQADTQPNGEIKNITWTRRSPNSQLSESQLPDLQPPESQPTGDSITITAISTLTPDAGEDQWEVRFSLPDAQPLVANPRLAAAYTYGYNLPLFAKTAQSLANQLINRLNADSQPTLTLSCGDEQAALAAAAIFCAEQSAPELAVGRLRLKINAAQFRFANVDSIRSPYFLPGSVRFRDLPGLLACLKSEIEFTTPSDKTACGL